MTKKREILIKDVQDLTTSLGVDPILVSAIISVESSWDVFAARYEPLFHYFVTPEIFAQKNKTNVTIERSLQQFSYGLMQVMGATARGLGFAGYPFRLFDPEENIRFGCKYLAALRKRYVKLDDVISAYNAGPGHPTRSNQAYVDKVLAAMDQYRVVS